MNETILKPTVVYAFIKVLPLVFLSVLFIWLAISLSPYFIFFGIFSSGAAWYRFLYIRYTKFIITPEIIKISKGIFIKRTDQVEMYRVKDYIVTQPLIFQIFRLMNVILKTTDQENLIVSMRGIPVSDIIEVIRNYVQSARQHNNLYEIN